MRLHHCAIAPGDVEKSIQFYRDVLGMTVFQDEVVSGEHADRAVMEQGARFRMVLLADEVGNMIELFGWLNPRVRQRPPEYKNFTSTGLIEVCFMVNSLDEVERRMKQHGYSFRTPVWPFGSGSDSYEGAWAKIRYLEDPDGVHVELIEVIETPKA